MLASVFLRNVSSSSMRFAASAASRSLLNFAMDTSTRLRHRSCKVACAPLKCCSKYSLCNAWFRKIAATNSAACPRNCSSSIPAAVALAASAKSSTVTPNDFRSSAAAAPTPAASLARASQSPEGLASISASWAVGVGSSPASWASTSASAQRCGDLEATASARRSVAARRRAAACSSATMISSCTMASVINPPSHGKSWCKSRNIISAIPTASIALRVAALSLAASVTLRCFLPCSKSLNACSRASMSSS
mmetsp:Transcript_66703/g.168256  ORF Transcript_66703/g.168256 Transcript_66703/m.168256 type:complete len:251 (+) Transcript_66703:924-1676(+)